MNEKISTLSFYESTPKGFIYLLLRPLTGRQIGDILICQIWKWCEKTGPEGALVNNITLKASVMPDKLILEIGD